MGRMDFVRESTYIILTEVDTDQTFVCVLGFSRHSIILVLVSDVEDVFAETPQHVLALVHNIEEC